MKEKNTENNSCELQVYGFYNQVRGEPAASTFKPDYHDYSQLLFSCNQPAHTTLILPLVVKHAYGRCPIAMRTQLSTRPLVTGHIWGRSKHPQSPQKMGEGDYGRILKGFVLFLILGRRADHPMIFHIFSISFLP